MDKKPPKTKKSRISDLEEVVSFAKFNKLLKVKFEGLEIELHPAAFQDKESGDEEIRSMIKEELRMEILEETQKQIAKENEELLYYSAR
jgi:hypothetical protein